MQSAGADGVLGVVDVVDVLRPLRARRILVQEPREAVNRVASDEVEVERGHDTRRSEYREQCHQPRRDARHDQHRPDTQYQDDGRTQVGLDHDEDEWYGGHHEQPRDVIHREPVRSALTVRRDRQDQYQYRELTRLYLEDADAVPAQGALGRRTDDVHTEQSQQAADVERRRHDLESPVVDQRHDVHHDDADADEDRLTLEVVVRVVAGVDESLTGRAVDHDDAGDAEGDQSAGQSEVEAVLRADPRGHRVEGIGHEITANSFAPSTGTSHHH